MSDEVARGSLIKNEVVNSRFWIIITYVSSARMEPLKFRVIAEFVDCLTASES